MFNHTAMHQADAIMARLGIEEAEGLAQFLEARIRGEQVRWGHHWQEVQRYSGAHFSGMEPQPFRPATDAELVEGARQDKAFHAEWRASARSRFVAAVLSVEDLGFHHEADVARAAYHRGFSPLSAKPNLGEVQTAINALSSIPSHAAKAALSALLEIMAEGRPAAMAAE